MSDVTLTLRARQPYRGQTPIGRKGAKNDRRRQHGPRDMLTFVCAGCGSRVRLDAIEYLRDWSEPSPAGECCGMVRELV